MFEQGQLKKVAEAKFAARASQNYSSESLLEQEQEFVRNPKCIFFNAGHRCL